MGRIRKQRIYPNLRAYFAAEPVRQSEFAERLGISKGYLSDLKNGRVRPSLPLAARLSAEAGVPLESFLSVEDS